MSGLDRRLKYTALSRVRSLQDLYIDGSFEPPRRTNISNDISHKEMARLREHHPYQFKLTFPEFNANHIQVIFHNIRSVEKYLPYVKSDFNYCYCNIILLVETRTKPSSTLELPDFEILSRIDGVRDSYYSYGSLVYVKKNLKPFVNVFHEVHHFGKDGKGIICVDIVGLNVQYKYANIAKIVVYKSPKCRIDVFLDLLQDAVIKSKIQLQSVYCKKYPGGEKVVPFLWQRSEGH